MVLLEVCVESVESAKRAIGCGANRLELCSALSEGGLTPTVGLLKCVKKITEMTKTPVMCLIRCRAGDFHYNDEEIEVMIEDIKSLKQHGADGFVIGALTATGNIDMEGCGRLRAACQSSPVTFSRAFDFSVEPLAKSLYKVAYLSCDRLLTSGRKENVTVGEQTLVKLVQEARKVNVTVMPGGGITMDNIEHVASKTGASELHMSAAIKGHQPLPGMGSPMVVNVPILEIVMEKLRTLDNAQVG